MNSNVDHTHGSTAPVPSGQLALNALQSHGETDPGLALILVTLKVERVLRADSPRPELDKIVAGYRANGYTSEQVYAILCAILAALDQHGGEPDSFTDPLGDYLDFLGGWCPSAFRMKF